MKLEVWNEPEAKEEQPTRVRLRKDCDDLLILEVVDVKGFSVGCGQIGYVRGAGFHRCMGLSPSLGFSLDDDGRIVDI